MNEDVEIYLMQVARQLRSLPEQQRESELREIESHLRAMIEAREVSGVPQREAVNEALLQFGTAWHIGRDLTYTWRKHQPESPVRSLMAALAALSCQVGALSTLSVAFSLMLKSVFHGGNHISGLAICFYWVTLGVCFGVAPLAGGYWANRIAPRRGWWTASLAHVLTVSLYYFVVSNPYQGAEAISITLFGTVPALLGGAWLSARKKAATLQPHSVVA